MNVKLWLVIGAIAVASCAWAQDDTSHYVITLDGWQYPQEFTVVPNALVPSGVTTCYPSDDFCGDPFIKIGTGGGSVAESGDFSFIATMDGDYDFQNTSGTTYTSMEVYTTLTSLEMGESYTCGGDDLFQNCGFVDSGSQLQAYFWDPYTVGITSGTATVTPEPSQWAILLLACAGIVLARSRRRSLN